MDYDFIFLSGSESEQERIARNLRLLFSARRGTVPMNRRYGLPMEFLDRPVPAANALIVRELADAAAEFVPEAKIQKAELSVYGGRVTVTVEVLNNG